MNTELQEHVVSHFWPLHSDHFLLHLARQWAHTGWSLMEKWRIATFHADGMLGKSCEAMRVEVIPSMFEHHMVKMVCFDSKPFG